MTTAKDQAKDGPPKKNMHIVVPNDLHLRVKMMCVISGTTLREFTEIALREKLEKDEGNLSR